MGTHPVKTAATGQTIPQTELHRGGNQSMWAITLVLEVLLTPNIGSDISRLTISHIKLRALPNWSHGLALLKDMSGLRIDLHRGRGGDDDPRDISQAKWRRKPAVGRL